MSDSQEMASEDTPRTSDPMRKQDRSSPNPGHVDVEKSKANDDKYSVTTLDEQDDPKTMSMFRKWIAVAVIGSGSLCATCASSIHSFAETGVEETFGVSHEVAILGISLFVMGLGTAPLIVGPLSELFGRNPIYRVSYVIFFALSFAVAFAPNIAVFLVFRFFTGMCGAAFLSVAGGSVSDLFTNETVATPMSVYTITPFLGPVIGPLLSGFIKQNTNWRWTYYLMCIWTFAETVLLFFLVPETYTPILLRRKARRLRKETGDERYRAPMEVERKSFKTSLIQSLYRPFQLIIYERMILLLDLWNSLILGILYLTFQAFPIIFKKHSYNSQEIGLSFLGIGLGSIIGLATQPFWNRFFARKTKENNGQLPHETRLIPGMVGAILAPASLFWLAFTTYKSVNSAVPIIASVLFGTAVVLIYTSSWTYLVVVYRPWAASVMAGNSFMRSCFAAGFPLFAGQMYASLGTVGATALLAGLCAVMAPLPFWFFRIGPRLREKSKFSQ